eukprot:gene54444-21850_t
MIRVYKMQGAVFLLPGDFHTSWHLIKMDNLIMWDWLYEDLIPKFKVQHVNKKCDKYSKGDAWEHLLAAAVVTWSLTWEDTIGVKDFEEMNAKFPGIPGDDEVGDAAHLVANDDAEAEIDIAD